MTVQTSTNVASFNGDAANKVFPIGYKFNSAADLVVVLLDDQAKTTQILTLNSDYTVTGAGDEEGGVVTLAVAPTSVQRLKVTRVVDILQLTDLRNQGKFYAEIHEDVFDLLIMIDQQQQTEIDDANAKSDEAVATANEANAKSDQAVAKADQNLVIMQAQYDAFEQGAALYVIGDYAVGLVISAYNQIFRKDGEFYRAAASLDLPYTLTGNWAAEAANFVSVGDAVLREDLASASDPLSGAELVSLFGGGTVAQALQFVTPEMFGPFSAGTLIQAIDTGKAVMLGSGNIAVTLDNSEQVQKFLDALSRLVIFGSQLVVTLPAGQHEISSRVLMRSGNNAKIRLLGSIQKETTISSISTVTGTSGNWSVTANLASAANISVGDVLCIRGVTPGVQAPGTYTGRPAIGALQMQFFQNGELALGGTTGTVTGSVLPDFVSSGDFLITDGRVKRMLNVTASGFTVDAANAPPIGYSGKQYWYTMRPSAAGTVTVSGTTVTGSGSTFLSRVNAGDLIAFMGYGIRKIQSVDSDSQLTLTTAHPAIATGVLWGVITAGEIHEGAWVVSAVSGNQVTWTNTARTAYAPPARLINGGSVVALKTNLVFSGTSGFVVDGGVLEVDRIGLRGTGGTATVGIDLRGEGGERPGQMRLGQRVGISGFHYGAWLSSGSVLQATLTQWGGQLTRGINAAGGEARIGGASIGGTSGIGVFVGEGAYARMADTRVHGCSIQGLRVEVGGSVWADFSVIGHNVADNILAVGGVNIHFVGERAP